VQLQKAQAKGIAAFSSLAIQASIGQIPCYCWRKHDPMSRKKPVRRKKRHPPRIRRLTSPGASPGTVAVRPQASRPVIHVIKYAPDKLVQHQVHDVTQLAGYLDDTSVTWINVDGLGDAATIQQLGQVFGLHHLALEDVVNVHQRAKVEEYADHLFIIVRMPEVTESLRTEQLSLVLGKHFVLTFQERPGDCLDPVRERIRTGAGRMRTAGADYLAYALIDAVVDSYFPVVDDYGERMESLEERISAGHWPHAITVLHDLRSDLMLLRRAIRPLRDALVHLMPDPHSLISEETQFYLRDCYDHTVQLIDLLDTYREMCSDLRDFHVLAVSNRTNEIMKVLTIMATIFIPLNFIVSLYGMNFNTSFPWNMPELNWPFGYPAVLILMLSVAFGLLYFFWSKGWLGDSQDIAEP
jgi:magnesium transporter